MTQTISINKYIAKIKNLPPLPEESVKIITAVNDPDVSIEALVKVISLSPVLVARLLGLANSAYFGHAGQITDIRRAVIQVLGLNLVKSLCLSIVLNVELDTSQCQLFDTKYFWRHALSTAFIAQKLANYLKDEELEPEKVYTSAMLLNIGLLAAIQCFPEKVNEALSNADHTVVGSVSQQMLNVVGKTQYEIGEILLARWGLPQTYRTVLKEFRSESFNGCEKQIIVLLELSHWLSTCIISNNEGDALSLSSEIKHDLTLPKKHINKVLEDIIMNKDAINELAAVIGG